MTIFLYAVTLLASLPGHSAATGGARIEAACMKQMTDEPKRQAICHCLQTNLQRKVKPAEMNLLADVYEGKGVAAVKLQKAEFSALAEMDAQTAENCAANPDWKIVESKPAPKAAPAKHKK